MKTISFKNPIRIKVNLYGQEKDRFYNFELIEVDAILFKQTDLPDYKFYIIKTESGYRLVEYSTGVLVSSTAVDKSPTRAASRFKDRLDQYGIIGMIDAIKSTLLKRGIANT